MASGVIAAGVFLLSFYAVSAALDDGPAAAVASVRASGDAPSAPANDPAPAVQANETDQAQAGDAADQASDAPPGAGETASGDAEPAVSAPAGAGTEAAPPATVSAEEMDALPVVEAPEFDEADLIHGGEGAQGAILAGPGIVRSSGLDRRTEWQLLVPSARLRARIVRVGPTPTNGFGAPDNPETIGWWELGPAPGQAGNVLLDGHVDFSDLDGNEGTGVCWRLRDTQVGDSILIRDESAAVHYLYVVTEARSVAFDDPGALVYLQPSRDPILTLITCEGSFDEDSHNYSDRRIVVAGLVGQVPFGP